MYKLLIFGGTNEGRRLWDFFQNKPLSIHISVASKYGADLLNEHENGSILIGKKNADEIAELISHEKYFIVIDASHPYATEVSSNIKVACNKCGVEYLRLLRDLDKAQGFEYPSLDAALDYLRKTTGNILLTTGSKELFKCANDSKLLSRLYVRVLPDADVINQCIKYGLENKQIIAMQGPFSKELNIAMLKQIKAKFLVTKSSGTAGGFAQKVEAAKKCGAELLIIGRSQTEEGLSEQEIINYVCKKLSIVPTACIKREVTLLGMGMGIGTLTDEAREALTYADVIIGGERMLADLASFQKPSVCIINAEKIALYINENTQYSNIVVVFSGDVGFYSGARLLYPLLENYSIKTIAGISAPVYFLSKLAMPWHDVHLCSLHGNNLSPTGYILQYHKCFFLLGKGDEVSSICKALCSMNLEETEIYVGEKLSYDDERIVHGFASNFCEEIFDSLSVLLCINKKHWQGQARIGIADSAFIRRPSIPMSKREVRTVSLSYLHLEKNDIFYDIGAGSGSVAIEGAFACPLGKVYAIEHNKEAISLLHENRKAFGCGNIQVVEGSAPAILKKLPPPDKVFIGGSGGELSEILMALLNKNPTVKIVINTITLETLTNAFKLFQDLGIAFEEITELSVAKGEKLANYHMMRGQNPIFIISGQGGGK